MLRFLRHRLGSLAFLTLMMHVSLSFFLPANLFAQEIESKKIIQEPARPIAYAIETFNYSVFQGPHNPSASSQQPPTSRWRSRHPVAFGALVGASAGFGAGFVVGMTNDGIFSDFTDTGNGVYLGVICSGIGALVGAMIGDVVGK